MLLSAVMLIACDTDKVAGPSATDAPPLVNRVEAHSRRTPAFTTIDPPTSIITVPYGITARGDVVGTYLDSDGLQHGFLLHKGVFTTIDFPGAEGTEARGIAPNGTIVGDYWMPGEPFVNFHGYELTKDGAFHRVDYPGHTNTIAQRILPDGTILGSRHDDDLTSTLRGVVIPPRGAATEITAFASIINGATSDLRLMVGQYTNADAGRREGFIIEDGVFTPLLVPGSSGTVAWDVNRRGTIVGVYRDDAGTHGFLKNGEAFTPIDAPGATSTRVFGINARGTIVGNFVDANNQTHGFVARFPDHNR